MGVSLLPRCWEDRKLCLETSKTHILKKKKKKNSTQVDSKDKKNMLNLTATQHVTRGKAGVLTANNRSFKHEAFFLLTEDCWGRGAAKLVFL